ncbi:hypothetical protein [Desulfovibrio sp. ZJ200]|uniref:hypothetical protein n=1 Tax=Desulfovibrio sp. ZJ200 TaxID=2709792 RepID=UPI0013EB090F|nr:hypothetical protein [Desulfovibrio sp. ZJ200]
MYRAWSFACRGGRNGGFFALLLPRGADGRCASAQRTREAAPGRQGREKFLEHFLFANALLTRKRQPPQRGVHSGENRVFRLNVTFDFHKKSKVICSSLH